jgi:hypothetical protein
MVSAVRLFKTSIVVARENNGKTIKKYQATRVVNDYSVNVFGRNVILANCFCRNGNYHDSYDRSCWHRGSSDGERDHEQWKLCDLF